MCVHDVITAISTIVSWFC